MNDPSIPRLLAGMKAKVLTEVEKAELAGKLQQLAAEFHADPKKGVAAGYIPNMPGRYTPVAEVGSPRRSFEGSRYVEWLKAIASRDLPPRTWRVDVGMGDYPGSSTLSIF